MKRPAVLLALVLVLLAVALLAYRIVWLGYPVFPTAPGRTWQLLIDVHVKGGSGETTLSLAVPNEQVGRMLVEEKVSSGALNFNLLREGPNRIGVWSGTIGPGEEEINYRAIILIRPGRSPKVGPPTREDSPPKVTKEEQGLAERLTKNWIRLTPTARIKAVAAATGGGVGGAFSRGSGHPGLEDRSGKIWSGKCIPDVIGSFRPSGPGRRGTPAL